MVNVENNKICPNCQTHNDNNSKFCVNCGYKLEKKDIFSFDKDEFKIDPSDYEELKDYRTPKEDNKKLRITPFIRIFG